MTQLQQDGAAARIFVRCVYPFATSRYTGATSAAVYDVVTGLDIGAADSDEGSVEHAWIDAQLRLAGPITSS